MAKFFNTNVFLTKLRFNYVKMKVFGMTGVKKNKSSLPASRQILLLIITEKLKVFVLKSWTLTSVFFSIVKYSHQLDFPIHRNIGYFFESLNEKLIKERNL